LGHEGIDGREVIWGGDAGGSEKLVGHAKERG
jgi:hypothetical protein